MKIRNLHSPIRLIISISILLSFSSCIYYEDSYPSKSHNGYDGRAFALLTWYTREPDYVETDRLIPSHFNWDSYYRTYPGIYTVHFEYDYSTGSHIETDAFDATVEIWIKRGEVGGSHYTGANGEDNYFELSLFPDGGFDFYINSRMKSAVIDAHTKTMAKKVSDSTLTENKNYTMKVVYKRVQPRLNRLK